MSGLAGRSLWLLGNKHGAVVAGAEQRSDNPGLELCEPEKVP